MSTPFENITITGIDKERSQHVEGSIFRVYLPLSSVVPGGWPDVFEGVWHHTFYSMKREAGVEGDALWIECVLDEMKTDHLPELKKAVEETNTRYKDLLRQQDREQEQQQRRDQDNRKTLDGLDDLDFN